MGRDTVGSSSRVPATRPAGPGPRDDDRNPPAWKGWDADEDDDEDEDEDD